MEKLMHHTVVIEHRLRLTNPRNDNRHRSNGFKRPFNSRSRAQDSSAAAEQPHQPAAKKPRPDSYAAAANGRPAHPPAPPPPPPPPPPPAAAGSGITTYHAGNINTHPYFNFRGKVTPEIYSACMEAGLCIYCKRGIHSIANCPVKNARPNGKGPKGPQ